MFVDKQNKIIGISQEEWKRMFAVRLIHEMRERGMSQSALARKSGLSVSRINDYIMMKSAPTIFAVINIATALDVKIESLAGCDNFVHD